MAAVEMYRILQLLPGLGGIIKLVVSTGPGSPCGDCDVIPE